MRPEPTPTPPVDEYAVSGHAALDEEEKKMLSLPLTWEAIRDHPTLWLTGIYIVASATGMAYHYHLLKRFGFNVTDFSDTSDFLMVAVRDPRTVALALLGIPFYMVYMGVSVRLGQWSRRRWKRARVDPEKRRKTYGRMRPWVPLGQLLFIGVYANVFVLYYSLWQSRRIKAGDFQPVTVHYKTDSPQADGRLHGDKLALVSTTSRYMFFYDESTKKSEVVPIDAIARLVWDARTRKERAADAAAEAKP